MHMSTVQRLQKLRTMYGRIIPIVEGGGYRCEKYEESDTSTHRTGEAVDPVIPPEDLYKVMQLALHVGFTGVGIKNKKGRFQLHLDDADAIHGVRPRPWIWTY